MDEGFGQRRRHHPLGVDGGRLDEVAKHVVVLDLQRVDAGLRDEIGLHLRDHAAAFVPQPPRGIKIGIIPGCDEAAVPDQQRWFRHQCCLKQRQQVVVADQIAARPCQHVGQILINQALMQAFCLRQRVADCGEVARPAAIQCQPRQRAVEVMHAAQMIAQVGSQAGVVDERRHRVLPRRDRLQPARGRGQPPFQQPRAGGGHSAVDGIEERPRPPAAQRMGQLQRPPRRRVDLHDRGAVFLHRRAQKRQIALLRDLEVFDQPGQRRDFGPAEGAEGVERGDPEQGTEAFFPLRAVEGGSPKWRQAAAVFSHDSTEIGL